MNGQIFISYRREESRWSARSLHDRLRRDFDPRQIFMDIDAIAFVLSRPGRRPGLRQGPRSLLLATLKI